MGRPRTLFVRYRLVPLASGYVPSGELGLGRVVSAVVFLFVPFALGGIERFVLSPPAGYLTLVAWMIGLTAGVRAFNRTSRQASAAFQLDEPGPLPTQRLNLAS